MKQNKQHIEAMVDTAVARMTQSMLGGPREKWLPPQGIINYVADTLVHRDEVDINGLNPHWIPVAITATIDWITKTGWWPYYYSSTFHSGEEYQTVYKYKGVGSMEMDPSSMKMFRFDRGASLFSKRRNFPGLSNIEKTELISFIRETYCTQLRVQKMSVDSAERIAWATLMWVLDIEGEDWLYNLSHIISSSQDFGVAFLHNLNSEPIPAFEDIKPFSVEDAMKDTYRYRSSLSILRECLDCLGYPTGEKYELTNQDFLNSIRQFQLDEGIKDSPIIDDEFKEALKQAIEGSDLLNPTNMICTNRPVGTCSNCGNGLWCVSMYQVVIDNVSEDSGNNYMCSACALNLQETEQVEVIDTSGCDSEMNCSTCLNQQCPHIVVEKDQYGASIPKVLIDMGSKQLESYIKYIQQQPSGTIHGVTVDDLTGYYSGNRLGSGQTLGITG